VVFLTTLFGDTESEDGPAPYRVLARKYRPATFSELIGQDAMVRTLAGAILSGRLPQAWILTGVRGVGKTTTARIIAKALNCTGRDPQKDGIEPCNACEACRAIAADRFVDVQEMDAASRTGVDDIREIVEGVRYGPALGAYKIYILDEVHMLSKNAFNALLKTLEEPPPHTKFIFATTEIRKVPVTVLSRCQRFDLRRIEVERLAEHFARIATLEDVEAEPEAIALIARAADGSVRDGLSLLDQAIATGGARIVSEDVKAMLGLGDQAAGLDLCRHVLRGAMREALALYDDMLRVGADPLQILSDMASQIHRLTRARILSDEPREEASFFSDMAAISLPALARAWQILLKGIAETQSAARPEAAAEMALIRVAYAADLPPPSDLIRALREKAGEEKNVGDAGRDTSPPPPSSGSRLRAVSGGEGGACACAVAVTAAPTRTVAPQPEKWRDIVSLFATNREAGLYAELCRYAHPVNIAQGQITIRLDEGASRQLVVRAGACLNAWTGRRWLIVLTDEKGGPTLAQEDAADEKARHERAAAHPLMRAVFQTFPQATLVELKAKNHPLPSSDKEEAETESAEEADGADERAV